MQELQRPTYIGQVLLPATRKKGLEVRASHARERGDGGSELTSPYVELDYVGWIGVLVEGFVHLALLSLTSLAGDRDGANGDNRAKTALQALWGRLIPTV